MPDVIFGPVKEYRAQKMYLKHKNYCKIMLNAIFVFRFYEYSRPLSDLSMGCNSNARTRSILYSKHNSL